MKITKYETNIKDNVCFDTLEIKEREIDIYWEWSLLSIDEATSYKWLGLGSSITESACINLKKLPIKERNNLIDDYFKNLNLQFLRLPIGSCDFSLNSYTYLDEFNKFSIKNDLKTIIPFVKDALKTNSHIKLISSPWTPPSNWKSNNSMYEGGNLLKEHFHDYADYLVNYIREYQKNDLNIAYITIQNEPFAKQRWESCLWSLDDMKEFIYNFLIPKLKAENIKVKVLLWDHNKENLFKIINHLYVPNEYIGGVAFHSYSGTHFKELEMIKSKYPELMLIETEYCHSFESYDEDKWLTSAELYLWDILGNINNGMQAFIDWNILLDSNGGPNHKENYCKSPVILNINNTSYIKTPIYYYLKHLALIPINAKIVNSSIYRDDLKCCVFEDGDNLYIIALNITNNPIELCFTIENKLIQEKILPHEIVTYNVKK